MQASRNNAPPPDLRIVDIDSLHPHEEHDSQRSGPLIERIRHAEHIINPPIVAPIDINKYVILDGANRCYTFRELGFPHILVQVASYESGYVELQTWQHIVSEWRLEAFLDRLNSLGDIQVKEGQDSHAVAHIITREDKVLSLHAPVENTMERNAALRRIVAVYQRNAILYRTAINEPDEIWPLFPDAIALVIFPHYKPSDIIAAAKYRAYLPPGISRHIIQGRALKVNYPTSILRDSTVSLEEKNVNLTTWIQHKLADRQIRYYAEATYQFDE